MTPDDSGSTHVWNFVLLNETTRRYIPHCYDRFIHFFKVYNMEANVSIYSTISSLFPN
jgi:hypothetical protein